MNITVTGSSFGIRFCHEHRHQCWELVFMLDGSCTTTVYQQTFQLQKGSVLITPPNVPHSTSSKESYSDMFLQCDAFQINVSSPVLLYDFDGSIGQLFSLIHTLNLQELRLTYAKKLLTNTNYTIKEIASLCGYADPYYFSRAFKKHFGAAPHYIQGEKVCDPINRTQPLSNV